MASVMYYHYSNNWLLVQWKWFILNSWLIWAAKLIFCDRLYARAGEMEARADDRCWLAGSFERALANFAILNQIIFLFHTNTWLQFECAIYLPELAWSCLNVCHRQLFNSTYNIFCFDKLKCWVLTAFQRHLCLHDITSYFVCISNALYFILLRITIL